MKRLMTESNAPLSLHAGQAGTLTPGGDDNQSGRRFAWMIPPLKVRGGWVGLCCLVLLLWSAFILSLPKDASAATVNLPKTGQQTCYDSLGTAISCAGTGQDGDWKAGVSVGQRFTPGAGATAACVTDNLTGLMWLKTPDSTTRQWQTALDYVKNTVNASGGLCGFTDWRVPSIAELETMVNAEQSNPAAWLNTQGFSNVQSSGYWSSSTLASNTDYAWGVSMFDGYVGGVAKTYDNYVWPVRGNSIAAPANPWETGQKTCYNSSGGVIACAGTAQDADLKPGVAWPNPRFTNNGNGTVTDNLTGLVWLKNANCFGTQTWDAALASANTLKGDNTQCSLNDGSVAGDWRLPNRKELFSLVDFEYSSPAVSNTLGTGQWIAGDPFDNIQSNDYWSSSTYALNTYYAWVVNVNYGHVDYCNKTYYYYVWPVRGGQFDHLTLLTLKGGETVLGGGTAEIKWQYQGSAIQSLDIELWKGGVYSMTVATGIPVSAGSYLWDLAASIVAGADYQIRLVNSADASVFTNGLAFTISTCPAGDVKNGVTTFNDTLQNVYNGANTNDVISTRAVSFPGLVCSTANNVNAPYITINGGLDCGFVNQIGFTYVYGPVSISAGTVEVNGIVIR